MASPYVEAAANRAAYLPTINKCPSCGYHPAMDHTKDGGLVIWCDRDECEGRDMQANGRTLKEVAAAWNILGVEPEGEPDPRGDAYDAARDEWERDHEG